MDNCRYDLSKPCDPDTCECDDLDDITEVTNYDHLREAVEFTKDTT